MRFDPIEQCTSGIGPTDTGGAELLRPTEQRRVYLPQLDSLRFFAFLSVFFFHALPNKDVATHVGRDHSFALIEETVRVSWHNGVGLFFTLSAFLITDLLRREKEASGTIDLKKFYIRRTLRIWPLYLFLLLIGILIQPLSPLYHLDAAAILTYLFFLKNWDVAVRGFIWNPTFVMWSVSTEEQFYVGWPLLQRSLSRRKMIALCWAMLAIIPLIAFWPYRHIGFDTQMLFSFAFFPVGGLLSLCLQRRNPMRIWRCAACCASGLILWFVGSLLVSPNGVSQGPRLWVFIGNELVLAGTVLLFLAFMKSDPKWSLPGLRYLGKISYGLYAYHALALAAAGWLTVRLGLLGRGHHSARELLIGLGVLLPLSLGLTIGTASLSYRYFEAPFLKWKDRFTVIRSRSI